ncbi:MAG: glycosyl hydrolase, partial [Bacteroidaceae bacterium]
EEYFHLYGRIGEKAREKGAQLSLYDEYGFPSGSMGCINGNGVSRFKNNHPGMTVKQLDKTEYTAYPLKKFTLDLSTISGEVMAVAGYSAMKETSVSLRAYISNNELVWTPPLGYGPWKVMVFCCVESGDPNVDYMNPEAVKLFIEDTHEQYYRHFPDAFGTVITSTFFDEPTTYRGNGRMWTEGFNKRFEQMYGFAPDSLYPALWYSIGDYTAVARNQLFSTRATLYAEGFMKTLAEWAEAHGIISTGHQDQEEILNTTCVSGDLMLDGKYMQSPGIDRIGGAQPTENIYKVVSSSANNWDHTEVMSETYGAMGNISVDYMYQVAIEQFTKGVNNLIPHAVWYNTGDVTFQPELSWRNPAYNSRLRSFNTFLARMKYILCRPGQHVADIAVLYPVQTLMGGTYLDGPKGYYHGGVEIDGLDYDQVSRMLTDEIGRDFTYIHPEVLDDRCRVEQGGLTMNNLINTEHFHTIILPSVKVISISNLRKIQQAWQQGVQVVFTTQTPSLTADSDATNEEIQNIVSTMLNSRDGKAVLVTDPTKENLEQALSAGNDRADVLISGGAHSFNYIHKKIGGHHIYLFGNIDGNMTSNTLSLRENIQSGYLLNPKTGSMDRAELRHENGRTYLDLTLYPSECYFLIEEQALEGDISEWEHKDEHQGMNYTIEMKVRVNQLSAGICYAAKDKNNYYMMQVNLEEEGNPRLRPHQWLSGGGVTVLADFGISSLVTPQVGKTFKLKIEVQNSRMATFYIDDVLVDRRYGEYEYGMIGFREDHNNGRIESAYFDDIIIKDGEGQVLYRQNFSQGNSFSAGECRSGWLYVEGSMSAATYAWQQDFQTPIVALSAPSEEEGGWFYDLEGRKAQNTLPGNIYVRNGRKFLLR